MSNFKEIVTKAVVGKGRKFFSNELVMTPDNRPSTILGCWVINHNFNGIRKGEDVEVSGSYDVNIWYSYDDNTKTEVVKDNIKYDEVIPIKTDDDYDGQDEIIVRAIKQPVCTKAEIVDDKIKYVIEEEFAAEFVGDAKIRIGIDSFEDDDVTSEIDEQVNEDFLK